MTRVEEVQAAYTAYTTGKDIFSMNVMEKGEYDLICKAFEEELKVARIEDEMFAEAVQEKLNGVETSYQSTRSEAANEFQGYKDNDLTIPDSVTGEKAAAFRAFKAANDAKLKAFIANPASILPTQSYEDRLQTVELMLAELSGV